MTLNAVPRATGSAQWADALLQSFAQAGYTLAVPPILQPAEPFLDLSGEDIRKSLYLTTDAAGEELCLRPDLTIPVARDYLASDRAGLPAGFSYLGPVFRYRGGRPSEFLQAGVESFGRQDRDDARSKPSEYFSLSVDEIPFVLYLSGLYEYRLHRFSTLPVEKCRARSLYL